MGVLLYILTDAGGQNKQHMASKNTAKLDRETEELHHEHVSLDTSQLIQRARQDKGWNQKELATVSGYSTVIILSILVLCVYIARFFFTRMSH